MQRSPAIKFDFRHLNSNLAQTWTTPQRTLRH